MCVAFYWIGVDWKIQKRIINLFQALENKGETIGKFAETCLLDWGIDKILTITIDNASSSDSVISYLKRRIRIGKQQVLVVISYS